MPRQLRIEYPGAIYHVMNRGDRREPIFHKGVLTAFALIFRLPELFRIIAVGDEFADAFHNARAVFAVGDAEP